LSIFTFVMKKAVALFLLLIPFITIAQKNKQNGKVPIVCYYENYALNPDSASTPHLYYQVYNWLGTRYKYAGQTKKGIDCSGFVSKMYAAAYCVSLSGGSADIFKTVQPLEKEELQEGDMVFFKIKKGRISHVGIYLGKNKFAHASVHSGVIISDLNEEYYKKYFYKGGRLLRSESENELSGT